MSTRDEPIYLDHNATTPIDPAVVEAMAECYQSHMGNPASQHSTGRRARKILEDSRERMITLLGVNTANLDDYQLVLTSGGTEANNLALIGLAGEPPGNIVLSSIEHPSVAAPADYLTTRGFEIRVAPVGPDGCLRTEDVEPLLDDQTRLVTVMLGNNETGVMQPVERVYEICRDRKIPIHTDAVQVVGKLPVDVEHLGVSALSFSAHKFHGPRGIGGLLFRSDAHLQPILFGGFQQSGLRPGTVPVALPVGMLRALELSQSDPNRIERMFELRRQFEQTILDRCPCAQIVGHKTKRLPHTSNIAFEGLDRQAILMALDVAGVACSTGSACASGSSDPSPVLLAMGLQKAIVDGSIRFSLGAQTTQEEIIEACRRIINVINTLENQK